MLALPNFDKLSVVETETLNYDIRAIIMQENHSICFLSRALGFRHRPLSVYEKELLVVVHAVQTWSAYLTYMSFVIKSDQKSLKILTRKEGYHFVLAYVAIQDYELFVGNTI